MSQDLETMLKTDTRTPSELFEALREEMKEMSGHTISEEEATRAARNLIGFCETLMRIPSANRSIPVETSDYAE